jgi:predicted transcriptional regulator
MSSLQLIGFSKYEARAYSTLIKHPKLNGYELAKRTGIPRANIYAVLDKLVQRGAVLRLEQDEGPRYAAVDPEQLLDEMQSGHLQALDRARRELAMLSPQTESAPVFNLHGEEWRVQAQRLIAGTTQSLLVAIQPREAAVLAEPLRAARERNVRITTLCLEACPGNCGNCQGEVHCYRFREPGGERWLMLLADERRILMARFDGAHTDAVLSSQPLLMELASAYMKQSLALAMLGGELADHFDKLLSDKTRCLLDDLVPPGDFIAWLKSVSGYAA